MAKPRDRSAQTRAQAELRAHYRRPEFRRPLTAEEWAERLPEYPYDEKCLYNLLLDEPRDPERNKRGLTHGTFDGYATGGCPCPRCARANSEQQAARVARALQARFLTDCAAVRRRLQELFGLDEDEAAALATALVSTGEESTNRKTRKPQRTYRADLLRLALKAQAPSRVDAHGEGADELVEWILNELSN